MSIKLQNRKAAEAKLGSFVESLSLPPALVQAIVQGDVDEGFRVRTNTWEILRLLQYLSGAQGAGLTLIITAHLSLCLQFAAWPVHVG